MNTRGSSDRCGSAFSRRREGGIALLEVVFATGIAAFALGAVSLTHWKTLQIVREAHRSVTASLVLQEKAEMLRGLSWNKLTDSVYVSGAACLGGTAASLSEQQVQSVNSLVETISISEYPTLGAASPLPSPTATAGYTVRRTLTWPLSGGAPTSSVTVVSSAPFPTPMSKVHGTLRVTWRVTGAADATPHSRDFETIISNPPQ